MAYINGADLILAIKESEHQFPITKQQINLQPNSIDYEKYDRKSVFASERIHKGPIQPFAFRLDSLSNRNATTGVVHRGPFILPLDTGIEKPDRYTERDWILISGEKDTLELIPENQLIYYEKNDPSTADNTTLEIVSYNRSFIIRALKDYNNNFEFFKLLSRSAEKNRLIIWNGYLCCHIVYLSAKNEIEEKNELVFSNKQKEKNRYIYLREIQERIPLFSNNAELVEFLVDIIPFFFFDKGASTFALYYKSRKFSLKWKKKEMPVNLNETVEKMVQSVINIAGQPNKWIKLDSKEEMADIVDFINYIIHPLRRYINADGYDRISKRLFQCSYIDCYATDETKRLVYKDIYKEKLKYSEEMTKTELNATTDSNFDRKARLSNKFFLIPVLGESNVLYRDCLYFMTKLIYHDTGKTKAETEKDKENDKLKIDSKEEEYKFSRAIEKEKRLLMRGESSFMPSLELYEKMVIFHGEHKTRRLMLPLKVFVNSIVCMEFEDYYYDIELGIRSQSYNIKDLKMEFIYAYSFASNSPKVSDFVKLVRIYARLYYILRLLPVPQLEDKWVNIVFSRYFNYFLLACNLFIDKRASLQVREPIEKEKYLFDMNVAIPDIEKTDYSIFKYKAYKNQLKKDSESTKNITVGSILEKLRDMHEFPLVSCCIDFETALEETIPKRLASKDFLSTQLTKIRTNNDRNESQFPVYKSEAFIFKFMEFKAAKAGKEYDPHSAQAINECEAYRVIKAYNIELYFPVICDIVLMHELPKESEYRYTKIKSNGSSKFFVIKMELLDWILEDKWTSLSSLEKVNYLLEILDILDRTLLQHNDLFLRQIGFKRGRLVLLDLGLSDFVEKDGALDASQKFLAYNDAIFMIEQIVTIQGYKMEKKIKEKIDKTSKIREKVNTKSSFSFAFIRNLLTDMQTYFNSKKDRS